MLNAPMTSSPKLASEDNSKVARVGGERMQIKLYSILEAWVALIS